MSTSGKKHNSNSSHTKSTELIILGCGTSSGVPLLACPCSVCTSKNKKNKRSRASVVIRTSGKTFLIDTSPDLLHQCMREKIHQLDAVLYTHPHADHLHGIDELRSFNFLMKKAIPCYGNEWTLETIRQSFPYIFKNKRTAQIGGGIPNLTLHLFKKTRQINNVRIIPLELIHGKMPVLGFRIKNVAYITDCSYIPEKTLQKLKNLDVLVLDCLRPVGRKDHPTHLTVERSIEYAKKIAAKQTFFTHMGHELDYKKFGRSLPKNMFPAFDGLRIKA